MLNFPKKSSDRVAYIFAWGAIHFICLFELLFVLPSDHDTHSAEYYKHVIFGLFLYINIMISFVMTITNSSTTQSMVLPVILKPGWRFCASCEANSPPRSFHCWSCDRCVLRRDHHCVFTGNCIGLRNQRHFLTFAFYIFLGALYCNYLNMELVWNLLQGFNLYSLVTMIAPLIAYIFGIAESYSFFLAIVASTCILGNILLGALLAYHLNNLKNGQVTFEASHNIKTYDLGWVQNCRQVFGKNWKYAWFCSLFDSPLVTDGTSYITALDANEESVKTM